MSKDLSASSYLEETQSGSKEMRQEGKAGSAGYASEQFTTVGYQDSVLWETSGRLQRAYLRVPPPEGQNSWGIYPPTLGHH